MLYFFLHEIDPSILPQQDRGSLVLTFFFSPGQKDTSTKNFSIILSYVFTTSATSKTGLFHLVLSLIL